MKKILFLLLKNVLLQIVSLSIIVGLVAFAAISWPTTPGGQTPGGNFQAYFDKIFSAACGSGQAISGYDLNKNPVCVNTLSSTGAMECKLINSASDIVDYRAKYGTPDHLRITYKYLSTITTAGPYNRPVDNTKIFRFDVDVSQEYSQGTFAVRPMGVWYWSADGLHQQTLLGSPDDLGWYMTVHPVPTPIPGETGIRVYKYLGCGVHSRDCPWGGTAGTFKMFEKYDLEYCNKF